MNKIQKINQTTFRQNKVINNEKIVDAIIGDEKQGKFFPRLKLKKWDNEVNFSVGIIDEEPDVDATVVEKDDVVQWEKGNMIAKFHPIDESFSDNYYRPMHTPEDGAFEMNITLKEKPETNVVNLSIQTKGLKFYYQPFLTEEEKLSMKVKRPLNVEGSYAVYHESKKDNEYKTGKFLHIYRPRVEDASGKKVWGVLSIDKDEGIMSVTIPQDFIDNAVYPIQHTTGSTFGYTSQGGSEDSLDEYMAGSVFTGAAGTATKISAWIRDRDSGDAFRCGVYTKTSTTAGTLLTNGISNEVTDDAVDFNFVTDFTFPANPTFTEVEYFLCVNSADSGSAKTFPYFYYDVGDANDGVRKTMSYSGSGFDASFSGATSTNRIHSIYATYTPAPTFNPAFAHRRLLL